MNHILDRQIFILLAMIFCHTFADYNLQGWLANAKCKSWWEKEAPDKKYVNDYKIALITHSFVWSFVMELPAFIWLWINDYRFIDAVIYVFLNTYIHAYIDDKKANKLEINLICDQLLHILQIIITWIAIVLLYK